MLFWINDDHLPLLVVSVLHCLLHAVFLLIFLGFLTFQSFQFFPPVFFTLSFLLRILPLSVHHLFLDKYYINDLSTTLEKQNLLDSTSLFSPILL